MQNSLAPVGEVTPRHDLRCPFNPQPEFYEARTAGRVVPMRLWSGKSAWLVSGYDDQRTIISSGLLSSDTNHPNYPHQLPGMKASTQATKLLVNMDDPEHHVFRRFMARDFMIRKIDALRPAIQRTVDKLIDDMLAAGSTADLVRDFSLPLPSIIISDILGVPYADQDYFQRLTNIIVASSSSEDESREATATLELYIGTMADMRREQPGDDAISRLVEHWVAGEINREEVVAAGFILLVGGHETTANMISLSTVALLEHPAQLAEIRASDDPAFIVNAVEELLRWIQVTHLGLRRVAAADIQVGDVIIRKGDGLILAGGIANRDPEAFEGDPDQLDIHRAARHHIGFGFGVHQCLGQPLARAEIQIVLATLYRRIPTMKLLDKVEDLQWKSGNFYGLASLPIAW